MIRIGTFMKRIYNVLASSTRQWNPGDEFILFGIKRLFSQIGSDIEWNWELYDRNPDLFIKPWHSSEQKTGLFSNSFHCESISGFDLIVMAGTPEWIGPHLKRLYELIIDTPKPCLLLGIGYPNAQISFSPNEVKVLSNAFITTRDQHALKELEKIGIPSRMLACPALFSSSIEDPPQSLTRVGMVIQSDRTINQMISSELKIQMMNLLDELEKVYQVDIICNYVDEFHEIMNLKKYRVRYEYDASCYEHIIRNYDIVVSTRLHAAILANSVLKPAIIINTDTRVDGAVGNFPFIHNLSPSEVLSFFKNIDIEEETQALLKWKRIQQEEYLLLIKSALNNYNIM